MFRRLEISRITLLSFLAIALSISGAHQPALAQTNAPSVDEFPSELVDWVPFDGNPVFAGTGEDTWDRMIRERGYVLREGDKWHLWYTGYNPNRSDTKLLGYATSTDGNRWTRHAGNPVFDQSWVEDMCVARHDSTYYMFAEGRHDIAHMLTSNDGVHWTDHGRLDVRLASGDPISTGPYGTPTVWIEDSTWYLFYERGDRGIWLATSKDRKQWTNIQDDPVIACGPEVYDKHAVALNQVIRYQGRYYGVYHANAEPRWKGPWTTCLAVSDDLVHWKKCAKNPVIRSNDSSGVLVDDGNLLRLYTMHPEVKIWLPRPTADTMEAAPRPPKDEPKNSTADAKKSKSKASRAAKANKRAKSLRALAAHLGITEGSTVADIGAGNGQDTWTFAEMVGEKGGVLAQEVVESKVKLLQKKIKERRLSQVQAVLGRADDPCLPTASADFAFMRYVYHHFSKPREMLRGIWRGLKPGGRLVIVDKQLGTLQDWVDREVRAKKHHWIAETTVVREAREEGFAFVECAEENWQGKDEFVLVFERPEGLENLGQDPDLFSPLQVEDSSPLFLPLGKPYQRPVFIALGEGRKLIAPILKNSSGQAVEIVLEEWATQKEERPPLPAEISFPSVLTEKGDPRLGPEPIDAVFFLDSYHLLFHGKTLLAKIRKRLSPTGCIYVLDREAKTPLARREASHRRMIQPQTVKQEMAEAGFSHWFEGPQPSPDRFLLVFGKTQPDKVSPEEDPFIGGPEISQLPGDWLKHNLWRLRGLRTTDGRLCPISEKGRTGSVEIVPSDRSDVQTWKILAEQLVLSFEKKDGKYLLTECRSSKTQ